MKSKRYLTVATDMFWMQLFWALSFLGVMLLVHVVRLVASQYSDITVSSFFDSVTVAGNIFM